MQRLFSTFPNDWPGVGLLLLRLATGVSLIIRGVSGFRATAPPSSLAMTLVAMISGFFILIGLGTPVAASLITLIELWTALSPAGHDSAPILLAALSASLVMLGPGAWSIDALLFGRRRVDFPEH